MLITLFKYMYFNCTDKFELFLFYCSSRFDINAISTMKPFLISQGKIVASSLGPHINLYGCNITLQHSILSKWSLFPLYN